MSKNPFKFIKNVESINKATFQSYLEYDQVLKSGLFDEEFYKRVYGDVLNGEDPLTHYLFKGYLNDMNPSEDFDTEKYYEAFPDVARSGMNPLVHYIKYGKNEGKFYQKSQSILKKENIIKSNLAFLNNYEFDEEPLVSIIMLNRNGITHLKRLFTDFDAKTNYHNYEIIVVDNASTDESIDFLESLKDELPITIIKNNVNVSFSKGNNDAAKIANGDYLLLLNNDIEPTFGWLNEMVGAIVNNENVAAVGAKLVFPYYYTGNVERSFTVQHSGDIFGERMYPCCLYAKNKTDVNLDVFHSSFNRISKEIAVTGAVELIDAKVYSDLGGLDEDYNYGLEDVDFSLKLHKNGYDTLYASGALLFHYESSTRVNTEEYMENDRKNFELFWSKWGDYLSRHMLSDKIEKNNFFTEKNLEVSIVDLDFKENSKYFSFIGDISKVFVSLGCSINVITNKEDIFYGNSPDILISFSPDYDVSNLLARKDMVKILISDVEIDGYDYFIDSKTNKANFFNISMDNPKNFVFELLNNLNKSLFN